MTPQIDDAHINKNDIADRAVDAITDRFASYGYMTNASTDQRSGRPSGRSYSTLN